MYTSADDEQELLSSTSSEGEAGLALESQVPSIGPSRGRRLLLLKAGLGLAGLALFALLREQRPAAPVSASSLRPAAAANEVLQKAAEPVAHTCSASFSEDCTLSQCCDETGMQCYEKAAGWAACLQDCEPGLRKGDDDGTPWSCKKLGSRFEGRTPKLFCFSLMRTDGYEVGLMKALAQHGVGIFACDGYMVLAQHGQASLGIPKGSDKELLTTWIAGAEAVTIATSGQGTAVNAELFKFAWKTILADGRYLLHDWTVKTDPDAVMVPWRMQEHMRPHTPRVPGAGGAVYVVNCNLYPANPNFPMIYGAVEVVSTKALQVWGEKESDCDSLPWKDWQWGEDKYIDKCLELLGITKLEDFKQVGDQRCTFDGCGDTSRAAYHPYKDVQSWFDCWGEATR